MYKIKIYGTKKRENPTIYSRPNIKSALKLLCELQIEDFYEIKIVKSSNVK